MSDPRDGDTPSSQGEGSVPAETAGFSTQSPNKLQEQIRSGGVTIPMDIRSWLVSDTDRYLIAGEFAKGGIGRVLEALDKRLDRVVAIKELLSHSGDDQGRFIREAIITARLQHPSIVPIHDLGLGPTGKPFYAMKLIRGSSLAELVRKTKHLPDRLALLPNIIAVAEAIAYAHAERIIHRDLKPANIIIGRFGETVVVDWGLATDLGTGDRARHPANDFYELIASGMTMTGAVIGTAEYMPVEQARGERVDERADVYAIGAMLYHVLTAQPPYSGRSSKEVIQQVKAAEPRPIEFHEPRVPRELAAIIHKAMSREPSDRYRTAKELCDDLKRFQTGQLVHAFTDVAQDSIPELSVRALRALVLYFERRFGKSRLEAVWAEEKLGLSIEHVSAPTNFVSFSYGQRLIDVLASRSKEPNFVSKAALLTASPEVLGFAYTIIKACGSPRIAYRRMIDHSSTYNKVGQFTAERLHADQLVLKYQSYLAEPNRNFCKFRMAQFASIPTIWGLPPAQASEINCQVKGADCCRYHLTWVRPVRRWKGVTGSLLGLACGAGVAALNLATLGIGLCSFGALGLLFGNWLDDRAQAKSKVEWFLNTQPGASLDSDLGRTDRPNTDDLISAPRNVQK